MHYYAQVGNNYYYRAIDNPDNFQGREYFSEVAFNNTGQ